MKKKVATSLLGLSLAFGVFNGSAFAAENEVHQPTVDYVPSGVLEDSNSVTFGENVEQTEPGEITTMGRVTIPAAIGRTEVDQSGLRFYGYASTSATSFVTMVAVHGYLGKDPYSGSIRWYDNEYNDNWMTSGATSVSLGDNVTVGATVGDKIICQAMHTVTTAFGTYSEESADVYNPIFT